MEAITIPKGFRVTPAQFEQLAQVEQLARMELTKDGELIIMSPTGGTAGGKNFNLYLDLGILTVHLFLLVKCKGVSPILGLFYPLNLAFFIL